jgi:predicted Zn-ribbon and HTH transcriptional regulator
MAKKKSKYNKQYIEAWKCNDCEFEWTYKTVRCPVCSTESVTKII